MQQRRGKKSAVGSQVQQPMAALPPAEDDEESSSSSSEEEVDSPQPKVENTSDPAGGRVVMLKDTDDRWKKWLTRFWSTVVMVGLFGGLIWLGHMALIVFVIVVQCWSFYEILNIRVLKHQKEKATEDHSEIIPFYKLLDVWFFVATLITVNGKTFYGAFQIFFADGIAQFFMNHHAFISYTLYTIGFIAFVLTLEKGKYRRQFRQLTWTVMTMICVVFAGSFHIVNILRGLFWFLLPCLLVICNDIWAFVWGFHFGKTSLIALSPRKTWEGFIGAFFSTIIFAFIAAYFMSQYNFLICPKDELNTFGCEVDPVFQLTEYQLPAVLIPVFRLFGHESTIVMLYPSQFHAISLAIFASLIAPFGGFFASGFKRAFKIKDFADLIPGHGGVTDRMDCQFVMGGFAAVYYATFIARAPIYSHTIMNMIYILPIGEQQRIYEWLGHHLKELVEATH